MNELLQIQPYIRSKISPTTLLSTALHHLPANTLGHHFVFAHFNELVSPDNVVVYTVINDVKKLILYTTNDNLVRCYDTFFCNIENCRYLVKLGRYFEVRVVKKERPFKNSILRTILAVNRHILIQAYKVLIYSSMLGGYIEFNYSKNNANTLQQICVEHFTKRNLFLSEFSSLCTMYASM